MADGRNLGPWIKGDIKTQGVGIGNIPDLYLAENHPMQEAQGRLAQETSEAYSHDEVFGQYCDVHTYINCPVDAAYEYAANIYSLEEWTFSVRGLEHVGNGLYRGQDVLAPDTDIYVRSEANNEARTVDYLCAWDQGEELWMRYYFRFIDAKPTFNKPGTIVQWLNCHHPYYDRDTPNLPEHVIKSQSRQDRPWVGDIWKFFKAAHEIELDNMKKILEYRFKKGF